MTRIRGRLACCRFEYGVVALYELYSCIIEHERCSVLYTLSMYTSSRHMASSVPLEKSIRGREMAGAQQVKNVVVNYYALYLFFLPSSMLHAISIQRVYPYNTQSTLGSKCLREYNIHQS
jgi:hypothetical protein